MIARDYITEWREQAPWIADAQVEQDLVISRALIEIFGAPGLARRLAFRGGTALFKLHLRPPARYSEVIDLVQIRPEPIGETFDAVRATLDPWLGAPRFDQSAACVKLTYRYSSAELPAKPMKLKIEINSLFRADMTPLLRPGIGWDVDRAGALVMDQLITRLR